MSRREAAADSSRDVNAAGRVGNHLARLRFHTLRNHRTSPKAVSACDQNELLESTEEFYSKFTGDGADRIAA